MNLYLNLSVVQKSLILIRYATYYTENSCLKHNYKGRLPVSIRSSCKLNQAPPKNDIVPLVADVINTNFVAYVDEFD